MKFMASCYHPADKFSRRNFLIFVLMIWESLALKEDSTAFYLKILSLFLSCMRIL
jgi:hypothetical protein